MIWLIGNKGMLGNDVEKLLKERGLVYWASDREIDISDYKALEKFGKDKKIKWVINCAGYTKVDKAEEEIDEAFKLNKDGVRNIAIFSAKKQIRLIHISTDYVFDGRQKGEGDAAAYTEDDKTHPINIYGKSKLAGEEEIKKMLEGYFVIRTAWLYGSLGNNFVFTMLRLFKEKEVIKVVDDQWGSPTYTVDLAGAILKIIEDDSVKYGIYHFTNEGVTNWYKFARAIYSKARKLDLIGDSKKVVLKAIKTEEYPTAAARPKNSILSKEKIKKEFNLDIRNWKEALTEYLTILSLQTK